MPHAPASSTWLATLKTILTRCTSGRRTRATLDAQANSKSEGVPISGDDAKAVMAKHLGRAGSTSPSGDSGITSGTYGSSGSSAQSQPIILTPSTSKPISLDAVR